MANANSRSTFIQTCLRRLGHPTIDIEVTEEQLDDRVDEALAYYWDYHFDGTEKTYYKVQADANTIANGTITLPDNIIGAVNIFPIDNALSSSDLFNIRYQIALNDLYTLTNISMVPYFMAMQHVALLEELLVGKQPIRYNRHRNIIHIDLNWDAVNVGDYLIIEAYQVVDPDTYTDVWKDRWLNRYATALIKRQWGTNLKKYQNMPLPGGIIVNGQQIYDEAEAEIAKLEEEMIVSYSLPAMDFIG